MEKLKFKEWLTLTITEWQNLSYDAVNHDLPFIQLGIRGKKTIALAKQISNYLSRPISPAIFFAHPTINALADFLFDKSPEETISLKKKTMEPIAIIGMACRVPGAQHVDEFWNLLKEGKSSVSPIPESKWKHESYFNDDKISTRYGGFIDNAYEFDSHLFPISNAELIEIDPQQRILLEITWQALEHACYAPDKLKNKNVGVFVGIHNVDYFRLNIANENSISGYTISGNALSVAAGRISYQFGFIGPSMAIDTACSSSLMAIHLACQNLRNDECDMAIAGGVNLILSPDFMIGLSKARMLSPTGQCHTFDKNADGYVRAEGCGVVVVKRLKDAIHDRDNILAIIRGSAVNQDGFSNGLTAPNKTSQIAVINKAIENAGVTKNQIDYIEAHGSGTVLGDLVELESLETVFENHVDKKVLIGSVKTNIGHTETAAGVLGLIKMVLALQEQCIPAHLGFDHPSPNITWDKLHLRVPTSITPWHNKKDGSRFGGISSFGFSGTNVHIILEESPGNHEADSVDAASEYSIHFSAAHITSLEILATKYADFIEDHPTTSLTDFCYSVNCTRANLSIKAEVHANNRREMIEKLRKFNVGSLTEKKFIPSPFEQRTLAGKKIRIPTYPFTRKKFLKINSANLSIATSQKITAPEQHVVSAFSAKKMLILQLAKLLNVQADEMDGRLSLSSYGFDSLMAINFNNWLKDHYKIDIPISKIINAIDISSLINEIEQTLQATIPLSTHQIEYIPRANKEFFQLSNNQQQLWFLQSLSSATSAYNLPVGIKLEGNFDYLILEKCINQLLERHEILRTNILMKDDQPMQKIRPHQYIALPQINAEITKITEKEIANSIKQMASEVLDLSKDPLFKATLISINKNSHLLILLFHHIIMDGWSLLEIFIPELIQLYKNFTNAKAMPTLSSGEYKLQYADYAEWQNKFRKQGTDKTDIVYWVEKLHDANFKPLLGTDYQRPAYTAYKGRRQIFLLDENVSTRIIQLSKSANKTLFSVLLAGVCLVIHRWSGEEDIVIGTTFSNRTTEELKSILGDFTNHLPLRSVLNENDRIINFIENISRTLLEALENSACSIQQIVEKVNPARLGNRNPLYNIACVMHTFSGLATAWNIDDDLNISFLTPTGQIDNGTSEIELLIEIMQGPKQLIIECEYDTEIFDNKTIETFFDSFQHILRQLSDNPDGYLHELSNISYLPSHVNKELVAETVDNDHLIHKRFEKIASHSPDAIALVYEDTHLTYQQLDQQSNKLAHQLMNNGVIANEIVAIYTNRSPTMIIAILGILKVGGCYVALEPQHPSEHIKHILLDTQAKIMVSSEELLTSANLFPGMKIITVNKEGKFHSQECAPLDINISSNDMAYVIYTSGSTGKSKGVAVTHYNISRLLNTTQPFFNFSTEDVWTLFHSYAFDFSVWEIWGALLYGGKLVILPFMTTRSPEDLYKKLIAEKVTVLNQTPSAFKQFISYCQSKNFPPAFSLKYIIFGGEKLDLQTLTPWVAHYGFSSPKLINMYGITETTVHTTYKLITSLSGPTTYYNNIGMPLPDLKVYILDKNKKLLPPGAIGEIYVGGAGVAYGYLNDPEKTRAKFLANFIDNTTDRIYRSGDLGRYLPDDSIQYLGRIDDQVKIRGFRIETGHIETMIRNHPMVTDCVVTLSSLESEEEKKLDAYVIPNLEKISIQIATEMNFILPKWKKIFNSTYNNTPPTNLLTLNYVGWKNSYTNNMLPESHMQEWLQTTVAEIKNLQPKNILEIGCGTGMILFNLLDSCESYTGTDISNAAIEYIQEVLRQVGTNSNKVTLYTQPAHDFINLVEGRYDVVVINSVIQYFPCLEYLNNVIEQLSRFVAPDGYIFIGDIRNHTFLKMYNTSVEYYKAQDNSTIKQIQNAVFKRALNENELLIAPEYFYQLNKKIQRIAKVHLTPRQGEMLNEMTKYRFNAVLSFDKKTSDNIVVNQYVSWQQGMVLGDIKAFFLKEIDCFVIQNIPDNRLWKDHLTEKYLATNDNTMRKEEIEKLIKNEKEIGLNQNDLLQLGKDKNYAVYISISNKTNHYPSFDCYFKKIDDIPQNNLVTISTPELVLTTPTDYSNNIPFNMASKYIVATLKDFLMKLLPDYMLPAHYIALEKLPVTVNGKLDKASLKSLYLDNLRSDIDYIAPVNAMETMLVEILQPLLKIEKISMNDKFFDLGGNSIIAIQLIAKIKSDMGLNLPLITIFANPTVTEIANQLLILLTNESKSLELAS